MRNRTNFLLPDLYNLCLNFLTRAETLPFGVNNVQYGTGFQIGWSGSIFFFSNSEGTGSCVVLSYCISHKGSVSKHPSPLTASINQSLNRLLNMQQPFLALGGKETGTLQRNQRQNECRCRRCLSHPPSRRCARRYRLFSK